MKAYKYHSGKSQEIISKRVFIADSFFRRFSGLLFHKPLKNDEIFVLKDCRSIHTIGMRYSLDAAFMDVDGKIIAVFENFGPWKITPYIAKAVSVLEARSGFLKKRLLAVGDRIIFE
jgi:uncharacterized membrane protein (UPF0127 family)